MPIDALPHLRSLSRPAPRTRARRGFTMLEVEIALFLAVFATVTLASLVMQQIRISRRIVGPFEPGSELLLVSPSDPLLRDLRLPAEISLTPPPPDTPPSVVIPAGDLTILTVDLDGDSISVVAEITPTAEEESP